MPRPRSAPAPESQPAPAAPAASPVSTEAPVSNVSAQSIEALIEQNQRLMSALIAERESKSAAHDEARTVTVTNVGGMSVVFEVVDSIGRPIRVALERRGDSRLLTQAQVEALAEQAPHFFSDGLLAADAIVPDGPNTIRDIPRFIASLPNDAEGILARIEQITSQATLFDLYNYIETKRFQHRDETGKQYTEEIAGETVAVLKETFLDAKHLTLLQAVQRRLRAVANIQTRFEG